MGWLWDGPNDKGDPLKRLDPRLREFLERESPVKVEPEARPSAPQKYADLLRPESQSPKAEPKVPAESLFPDGRYAHIWKTYRPQRMLDEERMTDQNKLLEVLEGFKYRKAEIGRAALENCAFEQVELHDCFRNGSWRQIAVMCRHENHRLERCYRMQAKFLKALGYLQSFDRPADVDERIQMHAYDLYHRMLDQEKALEEAKEKGLPAPEFAPLLPGIVVDGKLAHPTRKETESDESFTAARVHRADLPEGGVAEVGAPGPGEAPLRRGRSPLERARDRQETRRIAKLSPLERELEVTALAQERAEAKANLEKWEEVQREEEEIKRGNKGRTGTPIPPQRPGEPKREMPEEATWGDKGSLADQFRQWWSSK